MENRKLRALGTSTIAVLMVGVMLVGACKTAVTETATMTATITKNQTVTVTSGAPASSTAINTSVVPTTSVPPPTTKAVNWTQQITGTFVVSPKNAPIGGSVTATGTGFAANAKFDLMWQDVTGSWDVKGGEFYGRVYQENWLNLTPVQSDAQGAFTAKFTVPTGYGFTHDLVVLEGGTSNGIIKGKLAYSVDPQFTLKTTSGPVGSPITININGMGWKDYENSWMLLYDNKYTGILTATTTHGVGSATIPATGGVGKHMIQIIPGSFTFAFMNVAQGPYPKPTFTLSYTITEGAAIMPPEFASQSNAVVKATAPAANGKAQIWSDVYLAPVGTPMNIIGRGLTAGAKVDLFFWGMTGNRVSTGYQQVKVTVGTTTVSGTGEINFKYAMPDTHGGEHILFAEIAGTSVAETTFNLTPSAVYITPSSGPVGTIMDIEMNGLGWTVTENNYYMVVDNAYLGYTCGFNNYGTVNDFLPIAGAPGWHYVDYYPGIYRGTEPGKIEQYRLPFLTWTDHPGEKIPVLHFAYFVTG